MKKVITTSMVIFLSIITSTDLFAQQSNSDAWLKYNAEKKSEFAAGALEFLIPVLGHAYAGNAGKGVMPLVVSGGGLVVLIAGASNGSAGTATLGYLAYLAGRIWGIVSAVETAEEYNTNLKTNLGLSFNSMRLPTGKNYYELTLSINF